MGTTSSKQKYRRSVQQDTHVNLVRHQVIVSDHVSPMSSLSAVVSIPRSSWRKSMNTSSIFSSYEDDDASSPRTSLGSQKDIVFESKNGEITSKSKPFRTHHQGDEKEYDR